MTDKDFLKRVEVGVDTYIKDNVWDGEEAEILEEFVKWLYQQYGVVYNGKS